MFETEAVIHSLAKEDSNKPYDSATIIHENGNNDVVAEYKGIRYTAIYNPFVCRYYVDDLYGKIPNQNACPVCGEKLSDTKTIRKDVLFMSKENALTKEQTIKIGLNQNYDLIPKYGAPPFPDGTELVVSYIPDNNSNMHPETHTSQIEFNSKFKIINDDDVYGESDKTYGNDFFSISENEIRELRKGKVLCHLDEYGTFIKLDPPSETISINSEEVRKAATAIYLATESTVADHISGLLLSLLAAYESK